MRNTLLAVAVLSALTGGSVVRGDGVSRVEQRTVGDFNSFNVGWGFTTTATLGTPAKVTIEGDQNVVRMIETTVTARDLRITLPEGIMVLPVIPVRITLVSPTLVGVEASGGAHVTAEASGGSVLTLAGLASQTLRAVGRGGSEVTIKGTTVDAQLEFSGGSKFHGAELNARTLRFEGSGGSSGTVRASDSVTVFGSAQVNVESTGGSSIDPLN